MAGFAGNVLELRAADAGSVLAHVCDRACRVRTGGDRTTCRDRESIVVAPIPTIETLGGGSVRCMLAEVFLPH